ncbi:hypothetical protein [Arenimonas daejeonensis]|uniref:hypothetical protein n=1 Tax=Arenimonas daejeonensis TaxID=370777 RepID=UPI0011BD6399|nr:hypothetical protein [Arenimonas daejeonensis]
MLRFASMLLLGLAGTAMADEESGSSTVEQRAWHEYNLAAAAQPGDAVSDWLLADLFAKQLKHSEDGIGLPVDPALVGRLVEERDRLVARADAALMDDPVMLAMRLPCFGEQRDDTLCAARRARLAELDGDNGFTALVLMTAAWGAGDNAGFAAAAARGAQATHYESGVVTVFDSMRARFSAVPDTAVPDIPLHTDGIGRADANAMGLFAAVASPPFQYFVQPCRESEGELLRNCLAIARLMLRNQQSVIDAYIGAELLSRHGTEADKKEAVARRRELTWLQHQTISIWGTPQPVDAPLVDAYFATYASEGEIAALRKLMRGLGRPSTPPADWVAPGSLGSP